MSDRERRKIENGDPVWIINDRGYLLSGKAGSVLKGCIEFEYDDFDGVEYHYDFDEELSVFHKGDIEQAIDKLNEIWAAEKERWESIKEDIVDAIHTLKSTEESNERQNEQ